MFESVNTRIYTRIHIQWLESHHTVTMRLQSIDFLRLLKIRIAVFKCLGHFIKKVYSHNFASKIYLIYFSHFPEILV